MFAAQPSAVHLPSKIHLAGWVLLDTLCSRSVHTADPQQLVGFQLESIQCLSLPYQGMLYSSSEMRESIPQSSVVSLILFSVFLLLLDSVRGCFSEHSLITHVSLLRSKQQNLHNFRCFTKRYSVSLKTS